MELKTYEEGLDWLRAKGILFSPTESWDSVFNSTTFRIPADSGRKTAFARLLVQSLSTHDYIVFIIIEHGIWPSCENEHIFRKYRSCVSLDASVADYPFHLMTPDELVYAEGLLSLSLFFVWGVVLFSDTSKVIIRTSNDEMLEIASLDSFQSMYGTKIE